MDDQDLGIEDIRLLYCDVYFSLIGLGMDFIGFIFWLLIFN